MIGGVMGKAFAFMAIAALILSPFIPDEGRASSYLNIGGLSGEIGNVEIKTIQFHLDPDYEICPMGYGYVYLKVGDLEPSTAPGEPMLPMETLVAELPKGACIEDVFVKTSSHIQIEEKLDIVPTPEPVDCSDAWSGVAAPNETIYSSSDYFPGKALSYDMGEDNNHAYLYIRFYPVQYIPAQKRAVLITDADIEIRYTVEAVLGHKSSQLFTGENLIICPPDLFEDAGELEDFHDGDVLTDVVNTTWIYQNYDSAPDPPYEGYKNPSIEGWQDIEGYNYTLAKRIVAFLADLQAHPNLVYATLFGDGSLVPPSYYIYIGHHNTYNSWIPTDFFYGSPDYDLVPNYAVGRLPVRNSEEAAHVVQKIINWDENLDWEWFKNLTLIGGRLWDIWGNPFYDGELFLTEVVNRDHLNGMDITKLFRTEGKFTKESALESLSSANGIIYIIAHGDGDSFSTENDDSRVAVDDVISLPPNSKVPIVVSLACGDGAFDTGLYPTDLFDNSQKASFGEALLLSDSAGIAYIGSSRVAWGDFGKYHLDGGYLTIIKMPRMMGMLTYVFEAYGERDGTLADITRRAISLFVERNDFSHDVLRPNLDDVTLFEFVLLGDPVLRLPDREAGPSYQKPKIAPLGAVEFDDTGLEMFASGEAPIYEMGETVTIRIETDSPNVSVKLINIDEDSIESRIG
jgi:hypothetical protein